MLMRSLSAALLSLSICGPGVQIADAADVTAQREMVNEGTVGIISGGVTGTYIRIATDLADALDDGYELRILPIVGKGSVRNVEDLLLLRGIDVAIVQSDVLDFYKRADLMSNIEGKIHYITKLYNEEVHVLAKSEYRTIDALVGKRVNFGTEGSGTFMTASIVFDSLGIDVDITTYPELTALERLRAGKIDALVFVGGKPLELIAKVDRQEPLHLLAVPPQRIEAAYLPSELTADTYPHLIDPGDPVQTVAVGAVLAAYNWPDDHPRERKLNRFIQHFFADFDRLQEPPFHPKWREVDLTAPVPGWQRAAAAEEQAVRASKRSSPGSEPPAADRELGGG